MTNGRNQAVQLDPKYGKAWARLAKAAYVSIAHTGSTPNLWADRFLAGAACV